MKLQMKLPKKPKGFSFKFITHVESFMREHQILPRGGDHCFVCLSGGADSMSLLFVLMILRRKIQFTIEILHINHGYREESDREERLIKDLGSDLGIGVQCFKLESFLSSNLEQQFRDFRRESILRMSKKFPHAKFYQGHHLNDCYEWDLLQSLKSSNTLDKNLLGIPLKNELVIRPFLCVSKNHINRFVKETEILPFNDSSNLDIRFERNFLREQYKEIEKRFPKYLKHYVARKKAQLHAINCKKLISNSLEPKVFRENANETIIDFSQCFSSEIEDSFTHQLLMETLLKELAELSSNRRGSWGKELLKIIKSTTLAKNENRPSIGPLTMSGNVQVIGLPRQSKFILTRI